MFLFDVLAGGGVVLSRRSRRLVKHGINLEKRINYFSKSMEKAEKILTSTQFWQYTHSERNFALKNYGNLAKQLPKARAEFIYFKASSLFNEDSYASLKTEYTIEKGVYADGAKHARQTLVPDRTEQPKQPVDAGLFYYLSKTLSSVYQGARNSLRL